jgi:ubiquitin carboxyl-terminal hydrolase 8
MKQMWLGSKSVVEPSIFKKAISTFAPQFSGYHQHDAQELLAFLLDGIHEDLNRVKERPYIEDRDCDGTNDEEDAIENWKNYLRRNKSLIVDMFQGQLRNTCKCLKCGHVNVRFEPFMYLSLPMSQTTKSLDDCIDLYLKEESLSGDNKYNCEKCKTLTNGTKKQDLWMLPPVLIVHLKRFKYNDYGKIGTKNEAAIDYPITEWDLKSRVKSSRGVYPRYDLYAVANHMGGLGGGHYTAHALNRFDDTWYEFNDSSYRSVDESIHKSLSKSAYVLFYNRSEGDASMPLNERSPMIRRQSVSRPDLWPHSQVDDPRQVRNFTRASRRHLDPLQPPPLQPPEIPMRWHDASESATSTGVEVLTSITEGSGKFSSSESLDVKESPKPLSPPKVKQSSPPQKLPDPPSSQDLSGSNDNNNPTPQSLQQPLQRKEKFEKPKTRQKTRSTKPTQV